MGLTWRMARSLSLQVTTFEVDFLNHKFKVSADTILPFAKEEIWAFNM